MPTVTFAEETASTDQAVLEVVENGDPVSTATESEPEEAGEFMLFGSGDEGTESGGDETSGDAPTVGEDAPEAGDAESESGDTEPETGDAEPEGADTEPETGDSATEAGDAESESGDTEPEAGDAEPETGDTESEGGDAEPEAGDAEPEAGDAEPETGDGAAETGETGPEAGDDTPEAGDDASEPGQGTEEPSDQATGAEGGSEAEGEQSTAYEGLDIEFEETPEEEVVVQEGEDADGDTDGETDGETEGEAEGEAVTVLFEVLPETATLTVRPAATEENPDPEAIPAQADGSYLLVPGEYTYSAEAEGCVAVADVPFTVAASDEPLTIAVALEAVEADATPVGFEASEVYNGVKVTVRAPKGAFPEGSALRLKYVTMTRENKADDAVEKVRGDEANVVAQYTFDISIIGPDGEPVQPAEGFTAEVSFELTEAADGNLQADVYHLTEAGKGYVAEELDTDVDAEAEVVSAETEGFSLYTVEFIYNNLQYVLQGGESVPLSAILTSVGLTG